VLFARFEDAQKAAAGRRNVLLHPGAHPIKLIGGFSESEKAAAVCLTVYNIPADTTYAHFDRQCQESGSVLSVALLNAGSAKTGIAYFANPRAVVVAYTRFAAAGAEVELLHGNGLVQAMRNLRTAELPREWAGGLFFLKHLPPASNSELAEALASWGTVVAAFQVITPENGAWAASGVALFAGDTTGVTRAGAAHELAVADQPVSLLQFQGHFAAPPPPRPGPKLPDQAVSPRDWLRKLAALNVAPPELESANAKIAALTIDQTYALVTYPPPQVIEWLVARA
jgi:hypothetical protein